MSFGRAEAIQQQLTQERECLRLLLEMNHVLGSALGLRELLGAFSSSVRRLVQHECAGLALYDTDSESVLIRALHFPLCKGFLREGLSIPINETAPGLPLTVREPVLLDRHDIRRFSPDIARRILAEGLKAGYWLPLISRGRLIGALVVASLRAESPLRHYAELLQHLANPIAIAVENMLLLGQLDHSGTDSAEETLSLRGEIGGDRNFAEIVGESPALKRILHHVQTVAPTNTTILIQGETGTGKELVARAVHNLSARRERPLVKVNCAAIPIGLLESELFGHEKGAFTGATTQRIGRFEMAHGGSLFLDEVGDIPLELQPKLLRVLQEQEFERLGGARTIRVDVRIVAATNADLAQKVQADQFRSDLYYRLNVFPIAIPSLRERREDIPLLARYFTQKHARRMKKSLDTIPAKAMAALTQHAWPGNVREFESFIERGVILSRGTELELHLADLEPGTGGNASRGLSTLEHVERQHILRVLREARWVVGGASGAATRLGLKRTTLLSRIKKLGIALPTRDDISTAVDMSACLARHNSLTRSRKSS